MRTILDQSSDTLDSHREIHFHPDISQQNNNKRSPLEKLRFIRSFIECGIIGDRAITVKLEPEEKAGISESPKGRNHKSRLCSQALSFPAKNESEAKTFAMYMRLISLLIENLQKNIITTKRDLYYQDVSLFQNQGNVDIIIENLCKALGFTNQELGAVAAQKGLCYGDVTLKYGDDQNQGSSSRVFTKEQHSFLIPRIDGVYKIIIPNDIEYILVLEKDAVFNLLCDPSKKRIIITGKGFPDVLTRRFLSLLSSSNKNVPVLGISDIDPYGLNIMKQYKSGGNKSRCYLVNSDQNFDCPNLKLIDLTILDFIGKSDCLDISTRDFIYASKMLETEFDTLSDESENKIWKSELQRGMFFGKKAEIDVLKNSKNSEETLSNYINCCIEKKLKSFCTT